MQVDTTNILFICGGAFSGLEQVISHRLGEHGMGFGAPIASREEKSLGQILAKVRAEDLLKYCLIPEFIGRLPVVATLTELDEDSLIRVLTEPKNALTKQYRKLFALDDVALSFTEQALKAIAKNAIKRKTGARGLRAILEQAMLDVMYEIPSQRNIREVLISEDVINRQEKPLLVYAKEAG